MRTAVAQRQSNECPARQRIGVRRSIALEMIEHDETFRAGRDLGRLAIELREIDIGTDESAQPCNHRTGCALSAFEDVAAGIDAVGIAAPKPRRRDRFVRYGELKM